MRYFCIIFIFSAIAAGQGSVFPPFSGGGTPYTPGVGLVLTGQQFAIDTTITPQFTSDTAEASGNCSVGQIWLRTDTNVSWDCTAPNTWTKRSKDGHAHAAADTSSGTFDAARIPTLDAVKIGTGVLAIARLATGTPDGTKFVRDDGTLAVPPGGSGGRSFGATFDGGGSALTARDSMPASIPFACTISAWRIMADAGTATFKVWKVASGTAIPSVANSINTSGVSLSSGTAVRSTTLTDFTSVTVTAGDMFIISLTTVATATKVSVSVECQ